MFIGHYGPAFAGKAAATRIPLWVLFIAVQFLDVIWSIDVLLGIEHLRIVPGLMQASALDLYDMPYTHGLIGAALLAVAFGAVVAFFMRERRGLVFIVAALCVFSHWILDLVVHRPDLWIYDGIYLGFGLWRWLWLSLPLELATLLVGAWLYARNVPARRGGNIGLWVFVVAMAGVQLYAQFGPAPATPKAFATTALVAYLVLAALAAVVDMTRAKT